MPNRLRTVIIILAALVVADAALWFVASRAVNRQVDRWIEKQQAAGAHIAFARRANGGFPFSARVGFEHLQATWPSGLAWSGGHLDATVRPWNWQHVLVRLSDGHDLRLPAAGGRPPVRVTAAQALGTVALAGDGRVDSLDMTASTLGLEPGGGTGETAIRAQALTVAATLPPATEAGHDQPSFEGTVTLREIAAAALGRTGLGATIPEVALSAAILGAIPATTDREALATWRDAGGTVELRQFGLVWGPLTVGGSGTLALDEAMQPLLSGTVRIQGYDQAIDALVAARQVRPTVGGIARAALGLIAKPAPDSGPPTVEAPLTVQGRALYLAGVKLLDLAPFQID